MYIDFLVSYAQVSKEVIMTLHSLGSLSKRKHDKIQNHVWLQWKIYQIRETKKISHLPDSGSKIIQQLQR